MEENDMSQWYCHISGQQYGPISAEQAREWLAEGRLKPTDSVWCDGMADWSPAGGVPEFADACGQSSPEDQDQPPAQAAQDQPPAQAEDGQALVPVPVPDPVAPPQAPPRKPGKVQAIAIMVLVSGILNCASGAVLLFTCWMSLMGAYSIVLGILEIIYATKLLPDPIKPVVPAKYIAIMEIVNIVSCSVPSVAVGIISLVFYGEQEVTDYIHGSGGGQEF